MCVSLQFQLGGIFLSQGWLHILLIGGQKRLQIIIFNVLAVRTIYFVKMVVYNQFSLFKIFFQENNLKMF